MEDSAAAASAPTASFWFKGVRVRVKHLQQHLSWKPAEGRSGCCVPKRGSRPHHILYEDVVGVSLAPTNQSCSDCCGKKQRHGLLVHTFRRGAASPCREWHLEQHLLSSSSLELVNEWVAIIDAAVNVFHERPRNLLVFVNPYGGSKAARRVWEYQAAPVFQITRTACRVVETTHMDHARDMIAKMKAEEFISYDGVVAVGGDGLFQECMMGVMDQRLSSSEAAASAATRMRVGHIPAGSTDAVAWSLHGTRSVATAVLHIALGDRLSLDVARVHSHGDDKLRSFVCQAAYGFLGDVMRTSEGMRYLGPARYDVAGALMYLQLRSYKMELSYREAPLALSADICSRHCPVCGLASLDLESDGAAASRRAEEADSNACASANMTRADSSTSTAVANASLPNRSSKSNLQSATPAVAGDSPRKLVPSSSSGRPSTSSSRLDAALLDPKAETCSSSSGGAVGQEGWVQADGDYISVMCVVAPCRSDKSRNGIIPHGHLSDGRMYLVLVSKCHHVDYLRFLIQLTRHGLTHLVFPFVRIVPVTAVQVKPVGVESSWNVDGELLQHNKVDIVVQRGAVEVFARSVDL